MGLYSCSIKFIERNGVAGEMRWMVRMQVYATPRYRRYGAGLKPGFTNHIFCGATARRGGRRQRAAFVRGRIALAATPVNRIFADNASTRRRNSISFAKSPPQNFRQEIRGWLITLVLSCSHTLLALSLFPIPLPTPFFSSCRSTARHVCL